MKNDSHDPQEPLRDLVRQALNADDLPRSESLAKQIEEQLEATSSQLPERKRPHTMKRWIAALATLAAGLLLVTAFAFRRSNARSNTERQVALANRSDAVQQSKVESQAGDEMIKAYGDSSSPQALPTYLAEGTGTRNRQLNDEAARSFASGTNDDQDYLAVKEGTLIPRSPADIERSAAQEKTDEAAIFVETGRPKSELVRDIAAAKGSGLEGRGGVVPGNPSGEQSGGGYGSRVSGKGPGGAGMGGMGPPPGHGFRIGAAQTVASARDSYGRDSGASGEGFSGGEPYNAITDNPFRIVKGDEAVSTFSIDVDTASYANVRRFLTQGQRPPRDAVRIEELLNYFSYDYTPPKGERPFSVNMEVADCPWQPEHLLLRVGLKGQEIHRQERAASNLVFLVDVSGSMESPDKLPLLKQSLQMLVRELTPQDRVTLVTYAGEAGLRLKPTSGDDKATILSSIESLQPGGSTNGSAGIQIAYEQAKAGFIKEGTNRVILCTDGDLNVGISSDEALVELITKEAKSGVFLTVLGFGQGNLKDSKMEQIADHGNGIYAYIDGVREARKVLVEQMSGSLVTIAKDMKIQVEFNPAQVQSYRLIGYENRMLARRDFEDDKKDAGEIGAGHTVTAVYELVPATAPREPGVSPLKYQPGTKAVQQDEAKPVEGALSKELLTLKLRYKLPTADTSTLVEFPLEQASKKFGQASDDFRFAASVAAWGMALRQSPHRGELKLAGIAEIAASAVGSDLQGYRAEFLDLLRRTQGLGVE